MNRSGLKVSGIALWVSCLALIALSASCGTGNVGSPIQSELDAPIDQPLAVEPADEGGAEPEERAVSYTPGQSVTVPAGISLMNPQAYGWKGGKVKDLAGAPFVQLINPPGLVPQPEAWVRYHIKENVAGRLQTIMILGTGTKLRVNLYKWNSAAWQNFGLYDLNNGPVVIQVPAEYVQNGSVYLKLREPYLGTSQINSIEVNVF